MIPPRGAFVGSYSDRVSDNTETPATSTPADAATPPEGTDSQLKTESHDPAVPEAYATFMRQGWGERDLDLPAHP